MSKSNRVSETCFSEIKSGQTVWWFTVDQFERVVIHSHTFIGKKSKLPNESDLVHAGKFVFKSKGKWQVLHGPVDYPKDYSLFKTARSALRMAKSDAASDHVLHVVRRVRRSIVSS